MQCVNLEFVPTKKNKMKRKFTMIPIVLLLIGGIKLTAQDISCEDLMGLVEDEGYNFDNVGFYQLMNSSWLKDVKAFKIEIDYRDIIFVFAEIKKDEYGFSTKKYVFCNVPQSNWDKFSKPFLNFSDNSTYGERFHKYIIDYVCNCY